MRHNPTNNLINFAFVWQENQIVFSPTQQMKMIMTTIKDTIRQASLFTMNGLPDPRMMPGYEAPRRKHKSKSTPTFFWFALVWRRLSWR
ncbi:MAG TPA: hypothetical protein DGG95_08660 [Cytophagales bacterium]|nr:hypothetical protein [Cytophagales bacterium]